MPLITPPLLIGITRNPIVGAIEHMPVLAITKVGRYYRTTIPREVKKLLNINENDEIEWVFEDNKVIIRKKGEKHG